MVSLILLVQQGDSAAEVYMVGLFGVSNRLVILLGMNFSLVYGHFLVILGGV